MAESASKAGELDPTPEILIIGAGAMAGLIAGRLTAGGVRVALLDSWTEGIDAIHHHGLTLVELDHSTHSVRLTASSDPAAFQQVPLAVVMVKGWQTEEAAAWLKTCLVSDGLVYTLQNGMGNREILAAALGEARVAAGVTTLAGFLSAPGRVEARGAGEIILGPHPRRAELLALLQRGSLTARGEDDLDSLIWGKLLINAAINPLSAILESNNAGIAGTPAALEMMRLILEESIAVTDALGIRLPYSDPFNHLKGILERTAANETSMLQDYRRGAPTEIDTINGAVVRAARQVGLPAPVNQTMVDLVKAKVALKRAAH